MPSDIYIGGLQIHLYSVFFAAGLLAGYLTAIKFARKLKVGEQLIDSLTLVIFISGILGARLFYVLGHWDYYGIRTSEILQFWQGGLAFYGGLLGGGLGLLGFWMYKKFNLLTVLDVFAPGLAIGQAVGRLGNYFNREAFGPPTELPWKMYVPEDLRPSGFSDSNYFHPVFLYESIGLVFLFWILLKISKNTVKPGTLFAAYAVSAGMLRLNFEFYRLDALQIAGLKITIFAGILFILLGLAIFYRNASKAV